MPRGRVKANGRASGVARIPYFAPRRLGANAPHDRSLWRVDFRKGKSIGGSKNGSPGSEKGRIRSLGDENLKSQIELLLKAARQAWPS
jgi:hypothetical protein